MNVPFLSDASIEAEASKVLRAHSRRTGRAISAPIPIEDIVEIDLGLTVDYDDLGERFGLSDVLGAYCPRDRSVFINTALDPVEHPDMEYRCRFTLGHEGGHHVEHGYLFQDGPGLFDRVGKDKPSVICRTSQKRAPIEWQADRFSSFVLMPKKQIIQHWQDLLKQFGISAHDDVLGAGNSELSKSCEALIVRSLASGFKVSKRAMQIRLDELGLLNAARHPSLLKRGAA